MSRGLIGPPELLDDEEAGGLEALEEVEQVQVFNLMLGIHMAIQAKLDRPLKVVHCKISHLLLGAKLLYQFLCPSLPQPLILP